MYKANQLLRLPNAELQQEMARKMLRQCFTTSDVAAQLNLISAKEVKYFIQQKTGELQPGLRQMDMDVRLDAVKQYIEETTPSLLRLLKNKHSKLMNDTTSHRIRAGFRKKRK